MRENRFINILAIVIGVGIFAIAIGYFVLMKNEPVPIDQTSPVLSSVSTQQPAQTADWKTYQNERYGFAFKYPEDFRILEKYSTDTNELEVGELQVDLISTNQPTENDVRVKISSACLIPENIPKETWVAWENNLQSPVSFQHPNEEEFQKFIKKYEIGAQKLLVFTQGCYECYDGKFGSDPNNEDDGLSAYSCEAGLNKNGNKAARCLTIITERQKIGSPELENLRKFFLDDFVPTLELQQGSINVRECDGLGESVG